MIASIHDADARRCIDILQRPDGSLSYREFRRDPEDGGRWFPTGDVSHRHFATEAALQDDAVGAIAWLADAPAWRRRLTA